MDDRNKRYSHIIKYAGIFGGVQGLAILVSVVRNKIVSVLLGPDGVGLTALFNATIKFISDSTNLGISISAVREVSEAYETNNQQRLQHAIMLIRSWSFATALLGMLLSIALSPLLNHSTFQWGDHTLHFILLSPVVALIGITAGEMAVLKGTRQLRQLAAISAYNAILALIISVPLYYFWQAAAIVPSLFLLALAQMLLVVGYSFRLYPPRISFRKQMINEGLGMVRLGVAFVFAGILGSGAELVIRAFVNYVDSPAEVGLYSAGYVMTMTYAGMVFSAMETEYFPRLSAIQGVGAELNEAVNSQIEVCLLMLSPLLVAFMTGLPLLLPLLYSGKFLPVIGMMQVMVLAMFLRAMELPISYLPLAKGDSRSYLLMEACYDVVVVILVIAGYKLWGFTGAGVGITLAALFDFLMLCLYMRWRYKYQVSATVWRYVTLQLPIVLASYLTTFISNEWAYWTVGILLTLASTALSLGILSTETQILKTIKAKLIKRWRKK
ncbi:MAG: oligosaccharide flippase family protein [Prevotella sp.]|nr:oligosaccharide flippase family protein [Prevotella sp.]